MTILDLAVEGRLREALNALEPSVSQPSVSWELRKEYHDIAALYDMLLDYFRQGVDDPERHSVFTQLIGRTLVLCDKLEVSTGQQDNRHDFGAATFWEGGDVAEAIQIIRKGETSDKSDAACLLISDMTLSLLRIFDPRKVEVLCEAAASSDDTIAVRAVTAIAITVRRYGRRIPFYPDVEARLRLLGSDSAFLDMLADVELQFVRSRDTEQIERRMKDDIIPSMMRSPKAKGKHIITPDDLTDESNPEWSQWLKESGLEEKLHELTELQMSGSDVYMATFSQLKSYPFFNETANWFRPFDTNHPAVSHLFGDGQQADKPTSLQRLIMRSGMFCNSDKYSFCLSLASIPKEQLNMLQAQFAEQEEALREELGADSPLSPRDSNPSPRTLVRQYIQDLYRFFHLSPARTPYSNPFDDGGSQTPGDALHEFYSLPVTSLLALFELNLQRRDFPSAITSFDALRRRFPDSLDATLWQKNGYCHQRSGNHAEALQAYRMADLLKPDQYWTLHHTAQCQRLLGLTADALESYRRLSAMKPDHLPFHYRQAECLMQLGRIDEALPLLYRLAYDDPDNLRTRRAIIRAELLQHHPDAALRSAQRLLAVPDGELTDDDRLLIATAQWLTAHREEALATLSTQRSTLTSNPSSLSQQLLDFGIPSDDIPFLLDLARSNRKKE